MKETMHLSKKTLLLYLLEELSSDEQKRVEDHLHGCPLCRQELKQEKRFIVAVRSSCCLEPDETTMADIRLIMKERIRGASGVRRKNTAQDWIRRLLSTPKPVLQPAFALAVFVLGILTGRTFDPAGDSRKGIAREAVRLLHSYQPVGNIRLAPSERGKEYIKIEFSAVKDIALEGRLNDPEMQYILSYALVNESRDNIRLKTVSLLEEISDDELVQEALVHALKNDTNPGVRLKAIRILSRLPVTETIRKILVYAFFKDSNTGIRTEAAQALSMMDDPKVQSILAKRAIEDEFTKSLLMRDAEARFIPENKQL